MFEPLQVERIRVGIAGLPLITSVEYLREVESTNTVALSTGRHGHAVVTDFQSSGRGRRGRGWVAPAGSSALVSLCLCAASDLLPEIPKLAGLAVANAIEGEGLTASLKWPNDVEVAGRKVAGVLVESRSVGGVVVTAIGMGINVNWDPATTGLSGATSVASAAGRHIDREGLIIRLLQALDVWYGCLTDASDRLHRRWAERLSTLGQAVEVVLPRASRVGTAIGVQRDGGLLVQGPNGQVEAVYAADVSIRPIEPFTGI